MAKKKVTKKKVAQKKSVSSMSAAELRALANKIEKAELEKKASASKAEITALRDQRKALVAKHNKALAVINRKIKQLGGKSAKPGRKSKGISASVAVLDFVGSQGKASTKEIKAALEKKGVSTTNINQTLAYLKREGKIKSPARTIYQLK